MSLSDALEASYFVKPASLNSAVAGTGTAASPINNLSKVFTMMNSLTTYYTIYLGFSTAIPVPPILWVSPTSATLKRTTGPYLKITSVTASTKAASIKIRPWWCSDNNTNPSFCDASNSLSPTITWLDYRYVIQIAKGTMTWENANFDGSKLLRNSCAAEYCKHCLITPLLDIDSGPPETSTTGTGYTFQGNIPSDIEHAQVCLAIDAYQIAMISLETQTSLTFTSVTFTDFRIRASSLINAYKGTVTLTNIKFVNIEPGTETGIAGNHEGQIVAGIITTGIEKSATECTFPNAIPAQSAPWAVIIWNGGEVTGLNKYYNQPTDTSDLDSWWGGVISAYMAESVSIANVHFYNNFACVSDLSQVLPQLP